MLIDLFRFYHDIINIIFNTVVKHVMENSSYSSLVSGSSILYSENYPFEFGRQFLNISWVHFNLIVATEVIHEREHLISDYVVDQHVYVW